jgi:DNA-binding beta-propeller fold protein YncE
MRCLVACWAAVLPTSAFAQAPSYITQWGSYGTGDGQFHDPWYIASNVDESAYVSDFNFRAQRFSANGEYLTQWSGFGALATDAAGHVFHSQFGNVRMVKLAPDGTILTQWNFQSLPNGLFLTPRAVAVSPGGDVFVVVQSSVTSTLPPQIIRYTGEGVPITSWSLPDGSPDGLATDSEGNLYGTFIDRIRKFSATGTLLAEWVHPGSTFWGIAIDAQDKLYASDPACDCMLRFTTNGAFLAQWGSPGAGNGQFHDPRGVSVDPDGNVYVVDSVNQRVQKFGFAPTPTAKSTWAQLKARFR